MNVDEDAPKIVFFHHFDKQLLKRGYVISTMLANENIILKGYF